MRRLLPRLAVAVLTFCLGCSLAARVERYNARVAAEQSSRRLQSEQARPALTESESDRAPAIEPEHLRAKLLSIDRRYARLCHLPEDYSGGWPTVYQLERFMKCNEKWAEARREAIANVRAQFLVMY